MPSRSQPPRRRAFPRVVIEGVSPQVEGGRHPIKRTAGDRLRVGADLFKDGHDRLAGCLLVRAPGGRAWRREPLHYEWDPDRWWAEVDLDRIGRWQYTVEAWPDPWNTWREDLAKRLDAGQDVASEILEAARLLERAAPHRRGERGRELAELAKRLGDESVPLAERIGLARAEAVVEWMEGPLEPEHAARYERVLEVVVDRERASFAAWYEMFPRSQAAEPGRHGTFEDAARALPRIAEMGFDVVYLPPIHPIGRSFRKGPNNTPGAGPDDFGSPWAIGAREGGHTAVHPELGTLDDFDHFVRAAEGLGLEVALDFALQCAPDHPWVEEHPDWFHVRPDGTIRYAENPPKKYQDIYPLDFWCADRESLWRACVDALRFWIDHGVKTFRVDNPHTKPFAFWEWAIREIQREHPDAVFLSEAFTRPKRMYGLAKLGFTQSYTYFTWNNQPWELRDYLEELTGTEVVEYFRPNFFANTPDILHEYLQKGGRPAFRIRLVLAATLSPLYGLYSGFELCENVPVREGSEEYLDSEKYQLRQRDWDAPGNLSGEIALLNRIRRENAALQRLANLTFLPSDNERILAYHKAVPGNHLIVAVNLDPGVAHETVLHAPLDALGVGPDENWGVEDLLTGHRYTWRGAANYVRLDGAERVAHVLRVLEAPGPA